MNNTIYEMEEFTDVKGLLSEALLILAVDAEERSRFSLNKFIASGEKGKNAIVFAYDDKAEDAIDSIENLIDGENHVITGFPKSQLEFIENLKAYKELFVTEKIIIDVTSILTPFLFLLIQCIHMWNNNACIYMINTIPFDYAYTQLPFMSYKSYYGDLKMEEIIGFSGSRGVNTDRDLYIFVGFEGELALKVSEDTEHNHLFLFNALPSYYQKYKDISIINNYQLIQLETCKSFFVPAANPFEVYNILEKTIGSESNKGISIAPLCTKPIALGICMYALKHDNVRIVYPFSDKYEIDRSYDVYKSYMYKIVL